MKRIFIHLPAYREPELIPTIKSAIDNAKNPRRLVFGVCRQFNEEDGFDNLDEFSSDKRVRVMDVPFEEAQGLPWARYQINKELFKDEDYILQLDSHHRFAKDWDDYLIKSHTKLKKKSEKPILAGYLPQYDPFNDPAGRTKDSWRQEFASFYPHGTIFIRPGGFPRNVKRPIRSRFLSGHFCFAEGEWAREILHDEDIAFSGEELNLTVRSYTHGYDPYHLPKTVIWHATMRTERDGILVWDDFHKRGDDFHKKQVGAWAKIRQLLKYEDNGFDLTGYDLGTKRTLEEYEAYAGFDFKNRRVQQYTLENKEPHNPSISEDNPWTENFYHRIDFFKAVFKHDDYQSMIVAFDDENGESVHRADWDEHKTRRMLSGPEDFCSFENIFYSAIEGNKAPARWVMWGYSKSKGWAERIEGAIESNAGEQ